MKIKHWEDTYPNKKAPMYRLVRSQKESKGLKRLAYIWLRLYGLTKYFLTELIGWKKELKAISWKMAIQKATRATKILINADKEGKIYW